MVVLRKFLLALLDEMFAAAGGNGELADEPGTLADQILNDCRRYGELEECLQGYGEFMSASKEEKSGVSMEAAYKLAEYMQANLYKNLSLQEIADYFDISPSYICRLFKVYYSDTPISYYNRLKINEAKKMLEEYENIRVKDIAEMLGFSDQYLSLIHILIGGLKVFSEPYALTNGGPGNASQVIALEVFSKFGRGQWGLGTALNVTLAVFVSIICIPVLYNMRKREVEE